MVVFDFKAGREQFTEETKDRQPTVIKNRLTIPFRPVVVRLPEIQHAGQCNAWIFLLLSYLY